MTNLLTQAQQLAQEGVAIFPVNADKRPAIKGWRAAAATDAKTIKGWFDPDRGSFRNGGIGVPCGPDQDLICFDVDLGHTNDPVIRDKLQDFLVKWGNLQDDGYILRKTRSGGYHLIFGWGWTGKGSKTPIKFPRRIMPKLDVIIEGFYFVWDTAANDYTHVRGEWDEMGSAPDGIGKVLERDQYGDGSALMTREAAHEAMMTDGEAGIRHDALLRLTQDWAHDFPQLSLPEACRLFEEQFRDMYGDRIDADRLDEILEHRIDRGDVQGELGRAMQGAYKRTPPSDELLEAAGAKLAAKNSKPLLPQVQKQVQEIEHKEAVEKHSNEIMFDDGEGAIPPRPWMLGSYLIKGKVTTMSAPGGTGKSVLALVWAMCMATGRTLLNTEPHHKAKVLVWSGEDDRTEMRRRLRAIQIRHEAQPEGKLAIETTNERDMRLVTKNEKGQIVVHKSIVEALVKDLKAAGIEVLVLDPLISMHGVNENDNAEMDMVMDQLIEIAEAANVAVLVIHHVAKGAMRDDRRGDPADAARGATAIVNRARVALALRVMSEDEATKLQLSMGQRFSYVQVIDAKANLSIRAGYGSSDWVQLVSQPINNGDDDYPDGDSIGVPIPYEMAALMVQDIEAFILVVDAMEAETALVSETRRNKAHPANSHWLGNLVGASCDLNWGEYSKQEMRTAAQQAAYQRAQEIITSMLTEQLIEKVDVLDQHRHMKPGYKLTTKARARIEVLRAKLEAKG